ncbi:ISAs1 family transposase [Legionella sp. km535]|uniref:ISAs1 family transposase n=1 Tax=Legionella sp. km535 TaxID=2498107 RepID=UPI000F8E763F|nr:ISAs1 family transposase [Legionella sp. km535]RUR18086.1 ISAs1 family transposase [Legionella sp. km535]
MNYHYLISSLAANAKQIAQTTRSHWAVENSLHSVLNVTLREDDSRVRNDHAPEYMAMVRHIILNSLQNTKKKFKDMSIRRLQKMAGWADSTLDMILMGSCNLAGDSSLRSERRHFFNGTTVVPLLISSIASRLYAIVPIFFRVLNYYV